MGNTQATHAMARLGKIGSAIQEVVIEKAPSELLGLNMTNLIVNTIDDGSPCARHHCVAYVGMRLVSVNGAFVSSAAEVREHTKGLTELSLRFVPAELPLVIERRSADEDLGMVWTADRILAGTTEGGAGRRCSAEQYIGLRLQSVNGVPVTTSTPEQIAKLAAQSQDRALHLGFSIPLPDVTAAAAAAAAAAPPSPSSSPASPPPPPNGGDSQRPGAAKKVADEKRARALQAAASAASRLQLHSPNKWQHCNGTFEHAPHLQANGWPVWERAAPSAQEAAGSDGKAQPRYLYVTPHGYWRVTNETDDFGKGAGYIISRDRADARLPHEMPMWQIKRPAEGYVDDAAIVVCVEERRRASIAADVAVAAADASATRQNGGGGTSPASSTPPDLPPIPDLAAGMTVRVAAGPHVGKGGVVTSVESGGETSGAVVRFVDDAAATASAAAGAAAVSVGVEHVVLEAADEAAFYKEASERIGLRFGNDPTNLTLVEIVEGSPAHIFNVNRYVGRLLTHVNGTPLQTTKDVQQAVAGPPAVLRFRFAPQEVVVGNPIAVKLASSETLGRRSIAELAEAASMGFLASVFYLELEYMVAREREWDDARADLAAAVAAAVAQGRGADGAAEAARPLRAHQEFVVRELRRAAVLCGYAKLVKTPDEEASSIVLPSRMQRADACVARVAAYDEAAAEAAALQGRLAAAQDAIDELDVVSYTQKRALSRSPSDAAMKASLQKAEEEIAQRKEKVRGIVERMRELAPMVPELTTPHVALYDLYA